MCKPTNPINNNKNIYIYILYKEERKETVYWTLKTKLRNLSLSHTFALHDQWKHETITEHTTVQSTILLYLFRFIFCSAVSSVQAVLLSPSHQLRDTVQLFLLCMQLMYWLWYCLHLNKPVLKMKTQKKSVDTDRLSDLPDHLLLHIIQFMTAKHSVQTCLLSKRWKNLWKFLTNIEFYHFDLYNGVIFDKFVSQFLSSRDNSIPLHSISYANGCMNYPSPPWN
jgi:hypothetical protein